MPTGETFNGRTLFCNGTRFASVGVMLNKPIKISDAASTIDMSSLISSISEPLEFTATFELTSCANKFERRDTMKMSEEMAVILHLMMWKDMQRDLGNCPDEEDRVKYKHDWIYRNFPDTTICHNCFLCDWVKQNQDKDSICLDCSMCPIKWGRSNAADGVVSVFCNYEPFKVSFLHSPISEILALPARNPELQRIVDEYNGDTEFEERMKIREKAYEDGRNAVIQDILARKTVTYEDPKLLRDKIQKLNEDATVGDHIQKIKELAITEGYSRGVQEMTGQLDEAFQNGKKAGIDEIMQKVMSSDISSDSLSKIKGDSYEEGITAAKIALINWSEVKGLTSGNCLYDIWDAVKKKVHDDAIQQYKDEHPLTAPVPISMDVDKAFKQYGEEAVKGVKEKLAKASGLPLACSVNDHIRDIKAKAIKEYAYEAEKDLQQAKNTLSVYSGLNSDIRVKEHIWKIQSDARKEGVKDLKAALANESGEKADSPTLHHISVIKKKARDRGMEDGRLEAFENMQKNMRKMVFKNE